MLLSLVLRGHWLSLSNLLSVFPSLHLSTSLSNSLISSCITSYLSDLHHHPSVVCCHSHAWAKAASRSQQSSARHTASPRTQTPGSETLSPLLFGLPLCSPTGQGQSAVDPQTPLHSFQGGKDRPGPSSEGKIERRHPQWSQLQYWMYQYMWEFGPVTVWSLTPAGTW